MKKIIMTLCFATTLSVSLPVLAGTPDTTDPVLASFSRMLSGPVAIPAPAAPTQLEHDPLYQRLTMVLWDAETSQCGHIGHVRTPALKTAAIL